MPVNRDFWLVMLQCIVLLRDSSKFWLFTLNQEEDFEMDEKTAQNGEVRSEDETEKVPLNRSWW